MDVADFIAGSAALLIGLVPWIPASLRLARRMIPGREPAETALVAAVMGISGVVVVAELLGMCDAFSRWPFAAVSAVVALLVCRAGRGRTGETRGLRLPATPAGWVTLGCVAICVVVTSASLLGRDASVVGTGPLDLDSLHYHLSQAAQMVQRHNLYSLHHTASSDGTVYYPFDSELLDAVGMLGPHPDIAIFVLNLLFGWLALLACWVIGARRAMGAPALAAGAAMLALPIVTQASSGPGLNDIPAMAFVLSAVGCVVIAGVPREGRALKAPWVGALCAAGAGFGLSAGTKLNALPLAIVVALGVVVLSRGDRRAAALALVVPAFITGSFWYLRDWIIVGSPVPDLNLTVGGHGFHVVPYPEVKPYAFTVAHYLNNGDVIRHWYEPGLRAVWTKAWPLVGALFVVGIVLALVERSWLRRVVALAALLGFVAYLVTPTTAIGSPGAPILFATNTRYALPVLALALVLLATATLLRRVAVPLTVALTGLTLALVVMSALKQSVAYSWGVPLALAVGVLGLAARFVWQRSDRLAGALAAAIAIVMVVAGVFAVQRHYVHNRYAADTPTSKLFGLVGSFEHQRIGVAGHGLQYPFYGRGFSNTINYVGISAPSKAYDGPTTCPALIGVLQQLHEDYVVVEPLPVEHTARLDKWIAAIPGVTEIFPGYIGHVYKMPAVIPSDSCDGIS